MKNCLQELTFEDYIKCNISCLTENNGNLSLKRDHQYYDQVQQHLFTTEPKYWDFVVCNIGRQIEVVCERINPDNEHWNCVVPN